MFPKEIRFAHDQYRCKRLYGLELARHASHICSTLSNETLTSEIGATVTRFTRDYGSDDLRHFLLLLALRLEERGRLDAVKLVLTFVESGQIESVGGGPSASAGGFSGIPPSKMGDSVVAGVRGTLR